MINKVRYHLPSLNSIHNETSISNFPKALTRDYSSSLFTMAAEHNQTPISRKLKTSTLHISRKSGDTTLPFSIKEIPVNENESFSSIPIRLRRQSQAISSFSHDSKPPMKNFTSEKQALQLNSFRRSFSNISEKNPELDIFQQNIPAKSSSNSQKNVEKILSNTYWNIFLILMTIYVLFIDDIRTITIDPTYDLEIDISLLICTGVFTIEIFFNLLIYQDYRWKFFFWIDFISTMSIMLDTQLFSNLLLNGTGVANSAQIARASRISRIGIK